MPIADRLTDEVLFQHVQAGDADAFAELYQRFVRPLYHYGYRLGTGQEQARDAVQDVFVDIWSRRDTLGEVRNAKAYLLSCVRRKISTAARSTWEHLPEDTGEPPAEWGTEPSAEELTITADNLTHVVAHLRQGLHTLPKREYECLYLRFYENLAYTEVAQIMGISPQSARNTLGKALAHLRSVLPKTLTYSTLLAFALALWG
jgi:RNA polymerase sigma-70 factor (ECF subfamily)